MVTPNVHDAVAERTGELVFENLGAQPPLYQGFKQQRVHIPLGRARWHGVEPLSRVFDACECHVGAPAGVTRFLEARACLFVKSARQLPLLEWSVDYGGQSILFGDLVVVIGECVGGR